MEWVAHLAATFLTEERDHAGAAILGNKLCVLGGRERGQRNMKGTGFLLDFGHLGRGWRVSQGRMSTTRGVVTGTIGKHVFVFGGEGSVADGLDGIYNETEVFNTRTEKWKKLEPMDVPRQGGSAVAVGNRIYVPGGGLGEDGSPVNIFDVYRPSCQSRHANLRLLPCVALRGLSYLKPNSRRGS
ncbi:Kelch-like protein terF [Colletotrichum spinosum]|uniref:Kelch-like protein terF n=1 Tax=Colletotrichum spinosum TaxID=1347390 RepID=A0A4R8Q281_9PEZI|nr:Kelch-like protein terF [Colletotrichum spinosum]